jgi:hypothetical protein
MGCYLRDQNLVYWNDGILEKETVPITIKKDNRVAWAPKFE